MLVQTQMRNAFLNARVPRNAKGSIISAVGAAARVGVGMQRVPDWNAHLSKRTYDTLVKQGVMK
jgi:hypothetical protein